MVFCTEPDITQDSLFKGEITLCQNRNGYRFSIDAVLLAHFFQPECNDKILDIGTGCGVIALILLYRWASVVQEISGMEIQSSLIKLAAHNFRVNGFLSQGRVIQGDVKDILCKFKPETYDKVVCNPPFYPCGSGRMNKNTEANFARHHVLGSLSDFLKASSVVVKNRGKVFFIYPAESVTEFIVSAQRVRLEIKKIQFVYSYPSQTNGSRLALLQCVKNGGPGVEVFPPFYIYSQKNGDFSSDMKSHYKSKSDWP